MASDGRGFDSRLIAKNANRIQRADATGVIGRAHGLAWKSERERRGMEKGRNGRAIFTRHRDGN